VRRATRNRFGRFAYAIGLAVVVSMAAGRALADGSVPDPTPRPAGFAAGVSVDVMDSVVAVVEAGFFFFGLEV